MSGIYSIRHPGKSQTGFTLVELSIVLVIIGLMVGGVLVGKELIRSAELRAFAKDIEDVKMAAITYKAKFNYYPGDNPKASTYWPSCDTPATNCDGDGNGRIEWNLGKEEDLRFWQQLGDTGMYRGSYSGQANGSNERVPGDSTPINPINGSYQVNYSVPSDPILGKTGNFFGTSNLVPATYLVGNMFTVREAESIEIKLDDGNPGTGKMFAIGSSAGDCTTKAWDDLPPNAFVYADDDIRCGLTIWMD